MSTPPQETRQPAEHPARRAEGWANTESRIRYLRKSLRNVRDANESIADAPESVLEEIDYLEAELKQWREAISR